MVNKLTQRVQALPPELFEQIQAHVFGFGRPSPVSKRYIHIDFKFHFLKLLQINRSYINTLASCYFSKTVFTLRSINLVHKFSSALDDAFLPYIEGFRIVCDMLTEGNHEKMFDVLETVCPRVDKQRVLPHRYHISPEVLVEQAGEPLAADLEGAKTVYYIGMGKAW